MKVPAYQRNRVSPRAAAHFLFKRKKSCWPKLANSTNEQLKRCSCRQPASMPSSHTPPFNQTHPISILLTHRSAWRNDNFITYVRFCWFWVEIEGREQIVSARCKRWRCSPSASTGTGSISRLQLSKGGKKVNRSRREGASARLARMAKHFDRLTLRC